MESEKNYFSFLCQLSKLKVNSERITVWLLSLWKALSLNLQVLILLNSILFIMFNSYKNKKTQPHAIMYTLVYNYAFSAHDKQCTNVV